MWLLLNSAGRCSATLLHTGVLDRPSACAPQVGVGGLQLLDALGVRPDHEVGVGAHARKVVDAAHHHAPVLQRLRNVAVSSTTVALRSSRKPPGLTANTEHIV